MKHNKEHDNTKSTTPQLEPVRFEFTHPTASTVCVAGTFNDWHAEAKPLHPVGRGRWLKETVLPPGNYDYCLVVARERLAAALGSGQEMYARVREKAVAGVKTADTAVHEHPYQVIGLAFGVGALIGYLAARRHCQSDD